MSESRDARTDVERRIRHVGTGASDSRGREQDDAEERPPHVDAGEARADVAGRVRRMGTGASDSRGDAIRQDGSSQR
ncbi:hypothetical protein E1293_14435 [Actinomadura darangshiensis]|uniref:Uncharacterized protein n=1 Tax=Actinomadura darangshiensis TaxID=705336 RepID=A0A4R5BEB3_9ACTN|nr:hypothetical protein [Actinomadura darangshiensis]TDD83613.1 hypothetical protein E1293_14435 [Actinomadura darangshiensis]